MTLLSQVKLFDLQKYLKYVVRSKHIRGEPLPILIFVKSFMTSE